MNTVLLLDQSFKLSCKIADTLFRNNINVFRLSSEDQFTWESNRLRPVGIIVVVSGSRNEQKVPLDSLLSSKKVPVIVVSENQDEAEELAALEMGIAAYVDGRASCELIAARILHGLKIDHARISVGRELEKRRVLHHDNLKLDLDAHIATWRDQHIDLTCREMSLLVSLIQYPGIVKSRNSLIDEAYPDNIHVDERTVDSHMKRLRAKFRDLDPNFDGIQSVYGVGYRFKVNRREIKQLAKPLNLPHQRSLGHNGILHSGLW